MTGVTFRPCDIQGFLDFGLDWAKQVCAHLLQQLGEQDKEPVLQVLPVYCDEVHESFKEHAEDLQICTQIIHLKCKTFVKEEKKTCSFLKISYLFAEYEFKNKLTLCC